MEVSDLRKQTFIVFIGSIIIIAALFFLRFVEPSIISSVQSFFATTNENEKEATMQLMASITFIKTFFQVLKILFWFALVVVIVRFLNALIFNTVLKKAGSYELSGLIRSIVNIIIYLVSFILIFQSQYPETNLGAIFTTSTIIALVIGLALQETLGNLFAGFAIQADQPFQIGDVVTIPNKGTGVVETISWRGVKIRTFQNKLLIISNSVLGKEAIEVAPRDNLNARLVFFNTLYSNSPAKTIQTIREVVRQIENVSPKMRPKVRIRNLAADGIEWEVKYWCDDYAKYNDTDALVRQHIWYAFQREDIHFAYPTRTVYMHSEQPAEAFSESPDDIFERLTNVPIFTPLCKEEVQILSSSSPVRVFAPNEPIVRQGQKGKSMFVIHRGMVRIQIKEDGQPKIVGNLLEGDFFGEMGLFTGEDRTADVVAETETKVIEIKHHCLKPILEKNPELVKGFSDIIEERRAELDKKQTKITTGKKSQDNGVVHSIRKFFGLKG
jgi:small-conductance mechanosensitive channel